MATCSTFSPTGPLAYTLDLLGNSLVIICIPPHSTGSKGGEDQPAVTVRLGGGHPHVSAGGGGALSH
jgi:hypothetical protein